VHPIAERLQPVASELLAAWSRLPMRDCVPDRKGFDPMLIARILPAVSLLERVDHDEWRFRLIGTEIERRWGRSLTGCNLIDIVSAEAAADTLDQLRTVVRHPCGSWSLRRLELHSGRLSTVETLRLPLRAHDGHVNLILSGSGEISQRFGDEPDQARGIAAIVEHQFFDIGAGIPV
jgi:hypothetical protein